jgi:hypothetical protein
MIDQFLSGDLIQVIVSSIIKKVNQKTKHFYIEIRIVCLCNLERHYVQLLYSVTLTMLVLVRDYSAALPSDSIFFFARAMGRQRALHKENNGFASPTLGRHISTFCGNQILFSIRNPYINRFTNHFSIHS